jgi:hypothetical protein
MDIDIEALRRMYEYFNVRDMDGVLGASSARASSP